MIFGSGIAAALSARLVGRGAASTSGTIEPAGRGSDLFGGLMRAIGNSPGWPTNRRGLYRASGWEHGTRKARRPASGLLIVGPNI